MVEIVMCKRDRFGRRTEQKVSHKANEGHSIRAFFLRGGRSHREFEALDANAAVRVLSAMRAEFVEA